MVEKVLKISYDPCQSARIALVATEDRVRFIIATTAMKEGDLISTSGEIPRIPSKQESLNHFSFFQWSLDSLSVLRFSTTK